MNGRNKGAVTFHIILCHMKNLVLHNVNRIENIKSKQANDTFFLDYLTVLFSMNSNS